MMCRARHGSPPLSLASTALGMHMALGTVALPAQAQEVRDQPVPTSSVTQRPADLSALQMIEAYDKLAAVACENSQVLHASAEKFAESVQRFTHDLDSEVTLSSERAIEIRQLMENTVTHGNVVEGALRLPEAKAICESIAALYAVLLPKLVALRESEGSPSIATRELDQHYQRLLRISCTAAPSEKHRFIQLLVDHYGSQSIVPMYKVFVEISDLLKGNQ